MLGHWFSVEFSRDPPRQLLYIASTLELRISGFVSRCQRQMMDSTKSTKNSNDKIGPSTGWVMDGRPSEMAICCPPDGWRPYWLLSLVLGRT